MWHYSGSVVKELSYGMGEELWEAVWRPAAEGVHPPPHISQPSTQQQEEQGEGRWLLIITFSYNSLIFMILRVVSTL